MKNTARIPVSVLFMATVFCLMLSSLSSTFAANNESKPRMKLWGLEKAPGNGTGAITVHIPEKPNGTAAIICPGGGYGGLVTNQEGHGIAKWLNTHGITGIVLEYELPKGRSNVPLRDAQQALRITRMNAQQWNLKSDRIGIIGFSAGGHLASTAGTHFDMGDPKAFTPIGRYSCRPDFMILIYPVISMGEHGHGGSRRNLLGKDPTPKMIEYFSNELQVTKETPPAYLAHALNDTVVVPQNSKLFHEALRKNGVATEYLELPSGGHGLNGYKGPMWDAWQKGSIEWLAKQKLIPAGK